MRGPRSSGPTKVVRKHLSPCTLEAVYLNNHRLFPALAISSHYHSQVTGARLTISTISLFRNHKEIVLWTIFGNSLIFNCIIWSILRQIRLEEISLTKRFCPSLVLFSLVFHIKHILDANYLYKLENREEH